MNLLCTVTILCMSVMLMVNLNLVNCQNQTEEFVKAFQSDASCTIKTFDSKTYLQLKYWKKVFRIEGYYYVRFSNSEAGNDDTRFRFENTTSGTKIYSVSNKIPLFAYNPEWKFVPYIRTPIITAGEGAPNSHWHIDFTPTNTIILTNIGLEKSINGIETDRFNTTYLTYIYPAHQNEFILNCE